jgi:hypothetical protein
MTLPQSTSFFQDRVLHRLRKGPEVMGAVVILKIAWWLVLALLTWRVPPFRRRRTASSSHSGGPVPSETPRRSEMTTVPSSVVPTAAPRRTHSGSVENANKSGIKIAGQDAWCDYGYKFKGEKLTKDAAGSPVTLHLVYSKKDQKWVIESFDLTETQPSRPAPTPVEAPVHAAPEKPKAEVPSPAPVAAKAAEPAPGSTEASGLPEPVTSGFPASEKQVKYAKDLAQQAGLDPVQVNLICKMRFNKDSLEKLSSPDMKLMIPFLGGYPKSGNSGRS